MTAFAAEWVNLPNMITVQKPRPGQTNSTTSTFSHSRAAVTDGEDMIAMRQFWLIVLPRHQKPSMSNMRS